MKNTSPEIDAYIAKAPEFARPILERLRKLYHKACPQITETMKWRTPHFEYKGLVGNMAAFKKHVSFGFWKGKEMSDPHGLFKGVGDTSMCAAKVSDVSELPADSVLLAYIREAVDLNEQQLKAPAKKKVEKKKELEVPDWFMAALKENKKALATFEAFAHGYKKEYIEWITEAKQEATRQKRLATAIEWMAEGKPKNWKYMDKWKK